ncbi:DUF5684 domain-containing protein [Herbiconiux moechotypicola]|uniref:Signal peptidase I n=1 Tax=Herbiconiux moechotypicola TaxID=637393 RepID=A0ABN3E3D8_9MICO|nr:DUF5684 domain-containing protein [Herbiconiux moechotypicola]MCS5731602.1 DUF5684 domain-containing protein [Herbiconiux moechotypicola]
MSLSTISETSYSYSYQFDPVSGLFGFIVAVLVIIGHWGTFKKAGLHGWAAIIPFYNIWTLCKVAGRPGWWFIWYIIPIVNIVIGIIVAVEVARKFGRGGAFGFFLLFWPLPFIGYPILAFGSSQYQGGTAPEVRV